MQDVKTIFSLVCNEMVGRLMEIPGRIAPEIAGTSSPPQVQALLDSEFEMYRSWLEKTVTEATSSVNPD